MKKADAILCGDVHLREDVPICRTDDFLVTQFDKLRLIAKLQHKHSCPVLCSGDLFHRAKPSISFLAKVMQVFPEMFYTVLGNHDLPNHSLKELENCGVFLLHAAQSLQILEGTHFGQQPEASSFTIKGKQILIWHVLTYKTDLPFPDCTAADAKTILRKHKDYDLILTGDNHQPFTQKLNGRLLVNPGSMMRQEASQIEYTPAVWLWYSDTNSVEPVYFQIEKTDVTRDHLEQVEEKEQRIKSFVKNIHTGSLHFANFEENLNLFFQKTRVRAQVKELTYKFAQNGNKN